MPHVDTLRYRTAYRQSPFARPVAAITALAQRLVRALARDNGLAPGPAAPRIRQDLEVRQLEERFTQARHHGDVERMEREFDRREGWGFPMWR
jgi:hypothetical protein